MLHNEAFIQVQADVELHTIISRPSSPSQHPALLLLHFWGGSNKTYAPLISQLSDNFNIIAPSLRGWGKSSRPRDVDAYHITNHVSDIATFIQHCQTNYPDLFTHGLIVIGHSMGGKIVQLILSQPAVTPMIKGLVLLAPAPARSFALPDGMREQQMQAYDSLESVQFVIRNVLLGRPDAITDAMVTSAASEAVSGTSGAKAAWPSYGMAEDHEEAVINAVRALAISTTAPRVLIVVGELDRVETPSNVEARVAAGLRRAGADVQTTLLSGVGHLSPLEAPQKLRELIAAFAKTV